MAPDLDELFARLRRYERRAYRHSMDPELPRRVQRFIEHPRRRRPGTAAAAVVLVLLVAKALGRFPDPVAPADAGPIEARRLYAEARRTKHAAWPVAVAAYRRVLHVAGRADSIGPRSLRAIAGVYEDAHLPHAALAARYSAARASRYDKRLASYQLACARGLIYEGDLDAARSLLEQIVALGPHRAPTEHETALRLLAEEAFDRSDRTALAALLTRMDKARASPMLRIETRSRLGMLHLTWNAPVEARRLLTEARRIFARAQEKADDETARKAVRLWLDLPLRKALGR